MMLERIIFLRNRTIKKITGRYTGESPVSDAGELDSSGEAG